MRKQVRDIFKTRNVYRNTLEAWLLYKCKRKNKNSVIHTLQQITLKNILKTGAKDAHAHCIYFSCKAVFLFTANT